MKVYTSIEFQWDGTAYRKVSEQSYEYSGPVALCCGSTSAENQIEASQQNLSNTAAQQAQQIFGKDSEAYSQLLNTFSPTVSAGPSQMGFNAQQLSNLNSQAITQNGIAAKNAKQAAGEQMAAAGGGNTVLPSGTNAQIDANLATSAASNTANDLSAITEKGYEVGRENYDTAVQGLENAPGVFNSATSATSAAAGAGSDAASTANQIASQNNSWVSGVTGALGGIAGQAAGGWAKNGFGVGGSGSSGGGPPSDDGYYGG